MSQVKRAFFLSYGFASKLVIPTQNRCCGRTFGLAGLVFPQSDIRTERFGWMLVYGDLAWVPMTYCPGAFFLIDHIHALPLWAVLLILLFNITGFYIFRTSNLQKNRFRRDPDNVLVWGKKPEYLETKRGTRLLVSGFWGKARHINYLEVK